jgi:adenine-specific DNA-methyltransferase
MPDKIDKHELLKKIKDLDGLSKAEKSHLKELINTKKKYGLVWENKPEAVEEELRTKLPVLTEVKERAIIYDPDKDTSSDSSSNSSHSKAKVAPERDSSSSSSSNSSSSSSSSSNSGATAPNHILIEGDNLHALTALTFTHEGKIDLIYIDPPYNRGENYFIYNDNYIDKEDSFRHSKWLSFMEKRLLIAKRLMSNEGVIFISIDDNEFAQLKLLCDEIFLEQNFIECFQWEKTQSPSNLSKKSKKRLEYILCYEKNKTDLRYTGQLRINKNDNPLLKSNNSFKVLKFPKNAVECRIKGNHELDAGNYGTSKNLVKLLQPLKIKNGVFQDDILLEGKFVWTQENLDNEISKNTKIIFKSKTLAPRYDKANYDPEVPPNVIDERWGVATNDVAKGELEGFRITNFDYPKPVSLIQYLISFYPKNEFTLLDFFAGTGTTLESTIVLNNDDDGLRRCILVCNNEEKDGEIRYIPRDITYMRGKKVIKGYVKPNGQTVEPRKSNNLRYYQTAFVDSAKTQANRRALTRASTELIMIKEDCYNEITSNEGIDAGHARIFRTQSKYLIVVYHNRHMSEIVEKLVNVIERWDRNIPIKLYGFSPEKETLREEFLEVADRIEAVPLPDAIYNAYRNTFRTIGLAN